MLVMFCFLPGGGGAKAAAAIGSLALLAVISIVVIGVIALCVLIWISKSRRTKATCKQVEVACVVPTQVRPTAEPSLPTQVDLVGQIRKIDWFQFEKLVGLTYRKLGYTVEQRGGANPDGGIDLIVQKDGERIAIQCKHWQNWDVNVKTVREFLGALADAGIKKGIFVTLNGYTGDAKKLAERHSIEIVNQTELIEMLEATNARFDPETREILIDSRKFCPKCESELVIRKTKRGLNAGRQFWGCSSYPKCYFQMPLRA
jgi:HJR/Mrr/RecB family endonuclease